jgi:hypothetical protein
MLTQAILPKSWKMPKQEAKNNGEENEDDAGDEEGRTKIP